MSKPADREFWEEAQREAESGATVVLGSGGPLGEFAGQWIPAEKRTPPNAAPVLAWEADEQVPGCIVACFYFVTGAWKSTETGKAVSISHWLPLPLPPA